MKKVRSVCIILILVVVMELLMNSGIAIIFAENGTVSGDMPFEPFYGYTPIYTKQDLDNIRNNLDGWYYLANDIVFDEADFKSGGEFYNNGEGWLPIGYAVSVNATMNEDRPFTGIFDGCNYSIRGLKMNPSGSGVFSAMFAYNSGKIYRLDLEAELFYSNTPEPNFDRRNISLLCVKNWGVIESCSTAGRIEAKIVEDYFGAKGVSSGAIASYNQGKIIRCSNSADMIFSIPATGENGIYGVVAAGICSSNHNQITDCYNSGDISVNNLSIRHTHIAGIVSSNHGTVNNTYNVGVIRASGYGSPIISYNSFSTEMRCTNSVFLSDDEYLNRMPFLPGTKETSIEQMMQQSTYEGLDFNRIWDIDEGRTFPTLRRDQRNLVPELFDYSLGNGTQESPFVITNEKEFLHIHDYTTSYFRLDTDIAINNENDFVTREFRGVLDGNGNSLNNLFPIIQFNLGTIRNLYIEEIQLDLSGKQRGEVGGFVSLNFGVIENCHISGSITGLSSVYTEYKGFSLGGIAGSNNGVIRQCSSDISINVYISRLEGNIGGISGTNHGHIIECKSDSEIVVEDYSKSVFVGGIAGLNYINTTPTDNPRGLIERCYYSGDIVGFKDGTSSYISYFGGIAGANIDHFRSEYDQVQIKDCFFIGTISVLASFGTVNYPMEPRVYAGGLAGINDSFSAISNCYAAGSVEGISDNDFNQVSAGAGVGCCEGTSSFIAVDLGIRGIYDNNSNGKAVMCSPEEMHTPDIYSGFDFENVWEFNNQNEFFYPILKSVELVYTRKPVSFSITQLPNKQTFTEDEDFDFTGLEVTCIYNNGLSEPTEIYEIYHYEQLYYGSNEFIVSYDDGYYFYSDILDIEIVPKEFVSITMNSMPYMIDYFTNSLLDVSGGTITINYADSTKKVINITDEMIDQTLLSAEGKKSVNVSFYGKSTSFKVNVFSREIQSNVFTINRNKDLINGIRQGTKVSELVNGIIQKDFVVVHQDGQIASSNTIIKNGSALVMYDYFLNDIDMLYIIVSGDINCDGKITLTDFVQLKSHLLGKRLLNGVYSMAADINGDGKITLTDFVKTKAHLLGKEFIGG